MIVRSFIPALLALCTTLPAAAASSPLVGDPAPDFTLRAVAGGNVRLSETRGQVVVLSFYGSECNPCRAQLAQLNGVYRTYLPAGLTVYGVSIDDDDDEARAFAQRAGVAFPMLLDPSKGVGREYSIVALPTIVIIDRGGVVRYVHREPKSTGEPVYVQQLRRLLDE